MEGEDIPRTRTESCYDRKNHDNGVGEVGATGATALADGERGNREQSGAC